MQFENSAHKECYEKILPWMREFFGQMMMVADDAPVFGVTVGSTAVNISVWPWSEDDATITARSYVVTGAEMTPDLMLFLLQSNDNMRYGAFGLDKDKDIFFEHAIVGSTVDKEELKTTIMAVGVTADQLDDKIVEKWGGQRAIDRTKP